MDTVLASFDQVFDDPKSSASIWIVDDDSGIHGVAYTEPERMTDRVHNLLLVAVHPDKQKQGIGTKLVTQIERSVLQANGRLLLVETMAIKDFAHVRQLYERLGFRREAEIRDYYADGLDKVIYSKSMSTAVGG
ncbi:MAG: GNAT family N-acetyltransferase [Leptolyngbyaceae cyanobacterium]